MRSDDLLYTAGFWCERCRTPCREEWESANHDGHCEDCGHAIDAELAAQEAADAAALAFEGLMAARAKRLAHMQAWNEFEARNRALPPDQQVD